MLRRLKIFEHSTRNFFWIAAAIFFGLCPSAFAADISADNPLVQIARAMPHAGVCTASSEPVDISALANICTAAGDEQATEVSPPQQAAEPAPADAENQDMVLQLTIDNVEMEDMVEAQQRGQKLYLPLGQLSQVLDFAITVDPKTKTAKGWYVREQNTISLTPDTAEIKGKSVTLPPGSVVTDDQDIYVDSDLLSQWIPINFTTDMRRMTLDIAAREHLPFQDRMLREKLHKQLEQNAGEKKDEGTVKKISTPYEAFGWPVTDVTFGPSYDSKSKVKQADYSIYSVGDFGYLTARLFASGDLEDNALSDARLSFGRDDYTRGLLGPLNASSFRFGDINSASLSQVATPGQGRGFIVSSRALDRPDNFDVTNFIGDSQPGWQIELYRNGTLIDFQTVGSDGRYDFHNVPILYGNNQFRLAFYGPQGQVQEITKTVNAEGSLLDKNEFSYNASVDQKNDSVFGVTDNAGQVTGLRAAGEVEYGLSRWLTLAAGGARVPLKDGDHTYATSGLRTSVFGILGSVDGAYDTENQGRSLRVAASTSLGGTLLSAQQKIARNFFSEENTTSLSPIERETSLRADHQFWDISSSLAFTRKKHQDGQVEDLWINQLSKTFFNTISFTNTLQYNRDNLTLDNATGSLFARGYMKKVLLGGQLDYDVRPERQPRHLKLSALFPITPTITDNLEGNSDLQGDRHKEISNTATFDMGHYKISATGRATDDNDYFIGLAFNMSIGRMPNTGKWLFSSKTLAETGNVAVYPYVDENYNFKRDPGETAPPDSAIKVGSQTYKLDKHGGAVATQLATNTPLKIGIELDNQQANPMWTAGADAYAIVPRPGKLISLDFPVFETSQVDGTVSVPQGNNPQGLVVELTTTEGQALRTTRTAFDGYYLLEGIMPGSYKLHIPAESLAQKNLRQDEQPSLTVTKADFFVKDIALVDMAAPLPENTSVEQPQTPEQQPEVQQPQPPQTKPGKAPHIFKDNMPGIVKALSAFPPQKPEPVKEPVPVAAPATPVLMSQAEPAQADTAEEVPAEKGAVYVQLGSFRDVATAKVAWEMLQKKFTQVVSNLTMQTERADLGGKGVFHRLKIKMASSDSAKKLCQTLKKGGNNACFVVR